MLGIVSAVFYGLNPLFALPLYEEGMTPDSVLFYRYGFAAVLLAVLMKLQHQSFSLSPKEIVPVAVMGLLFSASSLFLYLSFMYMDAGLACTILFVYPVLVALIMFLFFHEHLSITGIFSILLALTGILLLYNGEGEGALSTTGVVLVLFSALSYAIYIVGVNKSALKEMNTAKLTLYALLFGILIYVVRLDFLTSLQPVPSLGGGIRLFAMAFLPTVVSLVCMAAAVHRIGSTITAVLGALEPVTALVIGVLLFDEAITPRITLGVILVIGAVTLIIVGDTAAKSVKKRFNAAAEHFAKKA